MRTVCIICAAACCANLGGQTSTPAWLEDSRGFCKELAKRANGPGESVPFGKPRRTSPTILRGRSRAHAPKTGSSENTTGKTHEFSLKPYERKSAKVRISPADSLFSPRAVVRGVVTQQLRTSRAARHTSLPSSDRRMYPSHWEFRYAPAPGRQFTAHRARKSGNGLRSEFR
jgi:hypothetical protein